MSEQALTVLAQISQHQLMEAHWLREQTNKWDEERIKRLEAQLAFYKPLAIKYMAMQAMFQDMVIEKEVLQ